MLETCSYCKNLVDSREYNVLAQMCHACVKLSRWLEQVTRQESNIKVELSANGHWKAYLIGTLLDLVASGHILPSIINSSDNKTLQRIVKNNILHSIRKKYIPDPKYNFEGDVKIFYFNIPIKTSIIDIILASQSDNKLPTLWMKSTQWKLWCPKIDKLNPQLRGIDVVIAEIRKSINSESPATHVSPVVGNDVISLVPQINTPFLPHTLRFIESGRYLLTLSVPNKGNYYLDVDVQLK